MPDTTLTAPLASVEVSVDRNSASLKLVEIAKSTLRVGVAQILQEAVDGCVKQRPRGGGGCLRNAQPQVREHSNAFQGVHGSRVVLGPLGS